MYTSVILCRILFSPSLSKTKTNQFWRPTIAPQLPEQLSAVRSAGSRLWCMPRWSGVRSGVSLRRECTRAKGMLRAERLRRGDGWPESGGSVATAAGDARGQPSPELGVGRLARLSRGHAATYIRVASFTWPPSLAGPQPEQQSGTTLYGRVRSAIPVEGQKKYIRQLSTTYFLIKYLFLRACLVQWSLAFCPKGPRFFYRSFLKIWSTCYKA